MSESGGEDNDSSTVLRWLLSEELKHINKRGGEDSFSRRLVKFREQIKDDQSFETDLNLIRDLAGSLVRISITRSKGISGIGWRLLHKSLRLLFVLLLSRWRMTARSKLKAISSVW